MLAIIYGRVVVTNHELGLLSLFTNNLIKLIKAMLDCLKNMCLELRKAFLDLDHVLSVGILLLDLFVQTVVDPSLDNVWIIMGSDFPASRVESRSVLCKQFDVLLCGDTSLVDCLTTLSSSLDQLLVLGLDLGV